jgi:hypothetical protein
VPDIEVDEEGLHRARLIEMTGPAPFLLEEGAVVPNDIRKGRVYLRKEGQFRSLHPWIVFRLHEIKQHLLLFNSSNRGYQFLDCDSGEIWSESQLKNYGLSAADFSLLPPRVASNEEAATTASAQTPFAWSNDRNLCDVSLSLSLPRGPWRDPGSPPCFAVQALPRGARRSAGHGGLDRAGGVAWKSGDSCGFGLVLPGHKWRSGVA